MYSFSGRIRYSETDQAGKLTIKSLMDYFQDCSVFHSESVGSGWTTLAGQGCAWLVAAWQIRIYERPFLDEEVVSQTWPVNVSGRVAAREFVLARPDGTRLAEADSLWLYYSLQKKRAITIPASEEDRYQADIAPRLDMPKTHLTIHPHGNPRRSTPTIVSEHLLDTNNHVNNAYYVEIARNAARMSEDISAIDVSYRKPAVLGDSIVPVVYQEPHSTCVELTDGNVTDGNAGIYATVRMHVEP